MHPPRLLTMTQAAAYLGLPVSAFSGPPIEVVKSAGRRRYDRAALDAFVDALSGQIGPPPEDDPQAALDRFLASPKGRGLA